MDDPALAAMAARYGKTPAQLIIRWCIEIGTVPLVKSTHPERIKENLEVFDFDLTETDRAAIDAFEGGRLFTDPDEAEF